MTHSASTLTKAQVLELLANCHDDEIVALDPGLSQEEITKVLSAMKKGARPLLTPLVMDSRKKNAVLKAATLAAGSSNGK